MLTKGKSKRTIAKNFKELYADNKKKGKARGANGKARKPSQIAAIVYAQKKK